MPLKVYESPFYIQKGTGLSSIFTTLIKGLRPLFKGAFRFGKKIIKTPSAKKLFRNVKKEALRGGFNVVGDTLRGENIAKSTKKNLSTIRKKTAKSIENLLDQPSRKKRRRLKKIKNKTKSKRRRPKLKYKLQRDIFD